MQATTWHMLFITFTGYHVHSFERIISQLSESWPLKSNESSCNPLTNWWLHPFRLGWMENCPEKWSCEHCSNLVTKGTSDAGSDMLTEPLIRQCCFAFNNISVWSSETEPACTVNIWPIQLSSNIHILLSSAFPSPSVVNIILWRRLLPSFCGSHFLNWMSSKSSYVFSYKFRALEGPP